MMLEVILVTRQDNKSLQR